MNTHIYVLNEETQILVRHTFLNRSDVASCLLEVLRKEETKLGSRNRFKPATTLGFSLSTVKQVAVDGTLSNILTICVWPNSGPVRLIVR